MATIIRASGPSVTVPFSTSESYVKKYWGTMNKERNFPATYWKIEQLLNASPTGEIAVHVKDMNSNIIADVEWLPHNSATEQNLLAPGFQPNDFYFILTRRQWNNFRPSVITSNQYILFARLAKKVTGGVTTYKVFFNLSGIITYNNGPSIGPDGGGGGVEIPPV